MRPCVLGWVVLLSGCCGDAGPTIVKVPAWDAQGDPDRQDLVGEFRLDYPRTASSGPVPHVLASVPANVSRLMFDVRLYKNDTATGGLGLVDDPPKHEVSATDPRGKKPMCFRFATDRHGIPPARSGVLVGEEEIIRVREPLAETLRLSVQGDGDWWTIIRLYSVGVNVTQTRAASGATGASFRCDDQAG